MEVGKLNVELRNETGKGVARKLRATGKVPGICYGVGLESPLQVTVDPKALKRALDPEKGQNTVIDLTVSENGKAAHTLTAMLWEYQTHPIKRTVVHVDLVAIDADKVVDVDVPVEFVGKAFGLIEGGQIHIVRRVIPVRCKPADIPPHFTVDLTPLDIGDTLHVSDIEFPAGVEPMVSEGLSLVSCAAPREDKAALEAEELALAEAAAAAEAGEGAAPAEGDAAKTDEKKD